jgi:hypothetical protein
MHLDHEDKFDFEYVLVIETGVEMNELREKFIAHITGMFDQYSNDDLKKFAREVYDGSPDTINEFWDITESVQGRHSAIWDTNREELDPWDEGKAVCMFLTEKPSAEAVEYIRKRALEFVPEMKYVKIKLYEVSKTIRYSACDGYDD